MHTHFRLIVVLVALLSATLLSSVSLLASLTEKYHTGEELHEAMENIDEAHASQSGLVAAEKRARQYLKQATALLETRERKKINARRALVNVKNEIRELKEEYGIDATNTGAVLARIEEEREHMVEFLRYTRARSLLVSATEEDLGISILGNLFTYSLGEMTDLSLRTRVLERARLRTFGIALRAMQLGEDIKTVEATYEERLIQYQEAWDAYREARTELTTAEDRIAEVKRITEEVESQILNLQRELARIDARLVARLERELIEKGLLDARPGERSDGRIRTKQEFRWPVNGRVSAGFLDAAYRVFFGVAHKGVDIVVPQGTAVSAVADGVVYLARDGGRFGYSYVLIGHRDGIATLYGHLGSINVTAGQEISGGHVIGSSGGTPGTYGAGPMTTGAHLHFEVIRNGAHVDPMTILP